MKLTYPRIRSSLQGNSDVRIVLCTTHQSSSGRYLLSNVSSVGLISTTPPRWSPLVVSTSTSTLLRRRRPEDHQYPGSCTRSRQWPGIAGRGAARAQRVMDRKALDFGTAGKPATPPPNPRERLRRLQPVRRPAISTDSRQIGAK